jgi:hypothetical protein
MIVSKPSLYYFTPSFFMHIILVPIPVAETSKGVGLRQLARWDYRFESLRGHGCLFLVGVVCCQVAAVSSSG